MGVEVVLPTDELLREIADNMRPADREEVLALGIYTDIFHALKNSVAMSPHCVVFTADSQPLCVMGVAQNSLFEDGGSPWMLGTVALSQHNRSLMDIAPRYIRVMRGLYPSMENYVHAKNKGAVRWLRVLGFEIEPVVRYGIKGELFHPFSMRS